MDALMILAIDPGPTRSAWLAYGPWLPGPLSFAIEPNDDVLRRVRHGAISSLIPGVVVIEQIEPRYGLSPGWETLDTARWVGVFEEAARPTPVVRLNRSTILRHFEIVTRGPGKTSADAGIRAALLDRFGGKDQAMGRKAAPGPLYGISKDAWSALSIATAYAEGAR